MMERRRDGETERNDISPSFIPSVALSGFAEWIFRIKSGHESLGRNCIRLPAAAKRGSAGYSHRRVAQISPTVRAGEAGDREAWLAQHVFPVQRELRVPPDEP